MLRTMTSAPVSDEVYLVRLINSLRDISGLELIKYVANFSVYDALAHE